MKKRLFAGLLIFLLTLAAAATGVDDAGTLNDPTVNERANACYDGGTMAGKCETDLAWTCGWYVIRVQFGLFAHDQVPAPCVPSQQEGYPLPLPSLTGCIQTSSASYYFLFTGGYTQGSNVSIYDVYDSTCTTTMIIFEGKYVYAPAPHDPVQLCMLAFNLPVAEFSVAPDIWRCWAF